MEKAHSRIKWENYPSIATPLNETNLNKMDIALDEVDNRVLGLDTAKLDKAVANSMVKEIAFDEATGIFTITSLDGTTKTVDTKLEKVATNFSYDYETQKLKLTLLDGTEQEIDMSTLISQYEFADTSTIGFTVGNEGKITAIVKDGSITEDKLQPNFLADIKVEVAKGKSYSDSSYENATTSSNASKEAKQYRDEAKQYRDEVQAVVDVDIATTEKAGLVRPDGTTIRIDADGTIHSDNGTVDYNELENKPKVNGVELSGNKTLDDLGIASKTELEKTTYKVDTVIANVKFNIEETASGEELHLIDSAEGKAVEFALYGKARQQTTSGKNKLDVILRSQNVSGIDFTVDNGKVITNGTATEDILLTLGSVFLEKGEYKLSGCPSGGGTNYRLDVRTGTAVFIDNGSGCSFTIAEDITVNCCIRISSGKTLNSQTFYPMIRLASITDDTYEPYTNGASPNPDYPQEIEVSGASGSVEVKSVGKNLLKNTAITTTHNGITFTVNEKDGTVTANGTATGTALLFFVGTNTIASEHYFQNMILSGCPNGGSSGGYVLMVQTFTDSSLSSEVGLQDDIGNGAIIPNTTHARIYIRIAKGVTVNNLVFKPMVSLESGEYQPYKETLSTIPTQNGLAGIKVSSNGNYTDQNGQQWICDEIVKNADCSGAYIQRIGILNKDDVKNNAYSVSSSVGMFYINGTVKNLNNDGIQKHVLCNYYSVVDSSNIKNNNIATYTVSSNGDKMITIKDTRFTTIEEFKTFIDDTNIEIYYVYAEPITTPLTAEEIAEISTFYPVTNISNDFDCGIRVKYNADSKNYIDKMVAEKVASIVANMNN